MYSRERKDWLRTVIVLVGERPSRKIRNRVEANGWGYMFIYEQPGGPLWGFDNGAFLDWRNGREFDEARYLTAFEYARTVQPPPYLAVVPDLVARGSESLEFSWQWRMKLPHDWPWYLALQDGMWPDDITPIVKHFDGLFLGGTDKFKREAEMWCTYAHAHGKRFHFARAGTEKKVKQAIRIGADSIDSSFPLWTMDRMSRLEYLVKEWRQTEPQLVF